MIVYYLISSTEYFEQEHQTPTAKDQTPSEELEEDEQFRFGAHQPEPGTCDGAEEYIELFTRTMFPSGIGLDNIPLLKYQSS